MNVKTVMNDLIGLSKEFEGVEYEIESKNSIYFYSFPKYMKEGIVILK